MSNNKNKQSSRHRARRCAIQALYQWHYQSMAAADLLREFRQDQSLANVDDSYFQILVNGVIDQAEKIDEHLVGCCDRPLNKIDPIELAVMRLAVYELMEQLAVPYRVVINEALELAKEFGACDGHKYVNGVLDKCAPKLRSLELSNK